MMVAKYLKLFVDCLEKYRKLSDAEFGRLVRAGLKYKGTGTESELTGREELLWDGMKLDIDRDDKKYDAVSQAKSEAGQKGALARWQKPLANSKCHLPYDKNGQDKDKDKDKDTYDDFFELVWQLYPKKEGKGSISKTQKGKLAKIGYEHLERCVNRYKAEKAETEMKYWKQGGTFFNSGYVDYLDENYSRGGNSVGDKNDEGTHEWNGRAWVKL